MFFLSISLILFKSSQDLRKSSSIAVCLLSSTYRISKLERRIYVNQQIIKTLKKLIAE